MTAAVFSDLVGQERAIATLQRAVDSAKTGSNTQEMTHAWLFTGPPGSGRSNAARAFAAALICKSGGCGNCVDCTTALAGSHPDVELIDVSGLSIKIDEIREVVTRSAWGASTSNWRIVVIEDSDRMTEAAANALLKALEEPGASTIWLLCAPTLHEVLPTLRSRCRHINLKTPTKVEITYFLVNKLATDPAKAELAAKLSQGHVGKARAYATQNELQSARKKSFEILLSAKSEASAIRAAAQLLQLAQDQVESRLAESIEQEAEAMKTVLQGAGRGLVSGGSKVIKSLEKEQKDRTSRAIKDELDGFLLDYIAFLRDCQSPNSPAINSDAQTEIKAFSSNSSDGDLATLITKAREIRELLLTNTSQTLLLESFFLAFSTQNRGN